MRPKSKYFKKDLPLYMANEKVIANISKASRIAADKRKSSIEGIKNWEEMREQAHQIRKSVIENIHSHLDEFDKNATKNGIIVKRAKNALEANTLAEEIAKENQAKRIVKSKSMITEEIGFNDHMLEREYEVIETDLGEYILQLAGESPSHLIGPAMHKSRVDIAELFNKKLNIPYSEDPQFLTKAARNILREKFLSADLGVTGANFGIVENGSIVIVENEGNARMCFTLPKVHIAFIGMERLIPKVDDLAVFMTLLSQSANGQKLTSYISLVKGLRSASCYDGAEKRYYIIVDNGRSSFLDDDHLKQALYCIRCSACYNVCPVYQNIGGHAYGWVYQGPIGAVITPQFLGLENASALPFASSLCGSCSDVCPVKIPLHHLLLHQRKRIVENGYRSPLEKISMKAFASMGKSDKKFNRIIKLGRTVQNILPLSTFVRGWSRSRELPQIAKTTFHEWWISTSKNGKSPKEK
jgi:L-lactate dehydrogenase complex protein LldF